MKLDVPNGKFDGYIFDCDGTVADTMPAHYEAWCEALEPYGIPFPEALFYDLGGTKTCRIVEILAERHGVEIPVLETVALKERAFEEKLHRIKPVEPVVALVKEYYGKAPLAVASGGIRSLVTRTLEQLGLLGYFQAVVTADDVTHGKPHPEPFLLAAERLGVPPERCLVFEDGKVGIEAARAAGMAVCIVPTPGRQPASRSR